MSHCCCGRNQLSALKGIGVLEDGIYIFTSYLLIVLRNPILLRVFISFFCLKISMIYYFMFDFEFELYAKTYSLHKSRRYHQQTVLKKSFVIFVILRRNPIIRILYYIIIIFSFFLFHKIFTCKLSSITFRISVLSIIVLLQNLRICMLRSDALIVRFLT